MHKRPSHPSARVHFFLFHQTGPIVCICNSINLIMSAYSPVAHYLKWFMGFIRANLPQHLVPLLVHGCDACLSLTELMLLLLSMCMLPSFPVFLLGWLNPGDFVSTVGLYCHCRCIASRVHLFRLLIIQALLLCCQEKSLVLVVCKLIEDPYCSCSGPRLKLCGLGFETIKNSCHVALCHKLWTWSESRHN